MSTTDSPTPEREPWRMKPEDALRLCDEFHLGQDVSLQMVCSAQTHTEAAVALGIVVPAAPDGAPPWTRQERADVAHAVALRAAQNGPARDYLRTLVEKVYAIPASRGDTTPLQSLAERELLVAPDGAWNDVTHWPNGAVRCTKDCRDSSTCSCWMAAPDGADAGQEPRVQPTMEAGDQGDPMLGSSESKMVGSIPTRLPRAPAAPDGVDDGGKVNEADESVRRLYYDLVNVMAHIPPEHQAHFTAKVVAKRGFAGARAPDGAGSVVFIIGDEQRAELEQAVQSDGDALYFGKVVDVVESIVEHEIVRDRGLRLARLRAPEVPAATDDALQDLRERTVRAERAMRDAHVVLSAAIEFAESPYITRAEQYDAATVRSRRSLTSTDSADGEPSSLSQGAHVFRNALDGKWTSYCKAHERRRRAGYYRPRHFNTQEAAQKSADEHNTLQHSAGAPREQEG